MTEKLKTIQKIIQKVSSASKTYENDEKFDVQAIRKSVQMQESVSVKQLQNQMKEFKSSFSQALRDFGRLKKQIQLRPTCHSLMENTILITTAIQSDPNIMKLMHKNQEKHGDFQDQEDQLQNDPRKQLKRVSIKLGSKIAQVNDGLPLLFGMIKELQKQKNTQIFQLKSLVIEKTQAIQDQLNQLRVEQISQRLALSDKLQSQYQTTQQKLRQVQTKQNWQSKDIRSKLNEKVSTQTFENCLQQTMDENKKALRKFTEESHSLVNPQKIKEIQKTIKENREKLVKDLIQCHLNIDTISGRIDKELVNMDFYKKQRTAIEKRISTLNTNFHQVHEKATLLKQSSTDHFNRLKVLEKENFLKNKIMEEMKTILKSLSITEDFQNMLSKIDPQKILAFQSQIQSLQEDNKHVSRLFNQVNEQIDKINNKFEVSGVIIPNKSREKEYHLNDLKEIIDQYFIENRFANKITKIQAQLNDGKGSVQAIKLLEKKVARLQKQSQFTQVIQQFQRLEQSVKRQTKILQGKLENALTQYEINNSYYQGLKNNMGQKRNLNDGQIELMRRKSLISESSSRMIRQKTENKLTQRSNSLRKLNPWQSNNKQKQMNSSFYKNTISSARKHILKSSNVLLGN